MRNIYQDDFSEEKSTTAKESAASSQATAQSKPVRPAKKAPPPIKKTVISNKTNEASAPSAPYGQPAFYPQPIFYQPDANGQPVPVYYTPVTPQPFTAPSQPSPTAPQTAPNEAGTRVLFQSDDFDKREEATDSSAEPHAINAQKGFDLTEISLSSKKRAPAPKAADNTFKVDDMEIGTYEFNIMTAGQTSKARSVLTPAQEISRSSLQEESYLDEYYEDEEDCESQTEEALQSFEKKEGGLPPKEIIRRCVLGISIAAIVIACATLINEYRLYRQNKNLMNDLSELIITQAPTTSADEVTDNQSSQDKEIPTTLPLQERPLSIEEQWEVLRQENPDITFPAGLQLKYAKLYAQNTDFVGYLRAEGSELDTPVVQGEDDNEYVEKNFYGESTKYACPFVTYTNKITELDGNTVIFGHRMRDGSIFGTLDQYRTLEEYKKAPVISFNTLYQDYSFKIIAAMVTNIYPEDDNGYVFTYYWTNLNNELNQTAYLNQLSQRSLYDTGVDVLPSDKLLTLSTCCKDFENARFVIVARLVRPDESTEVDTSKAIENENPRYPQAYYDEKGIENPFAEAYKWEIS